MQRSAQGHTTSTHALFHCTAELLQEHDSLGSCEAALFHNGLRVTLPVAMCLIPPRKACPAELARFWAAARGLSCTNCLSVFLHL